MKQTKQTETFKEKLLKHQGENNRIWLREFEKNGNSTKSIWENISPPNPEGMGI